MHAAPSVILFTVMSGAGFGYLALLGLGAAAAAGGVAFWQFFLAFGLAVGGLVAATFHLGNPQRGLLAFTQWRTSWLSREGWCAVAALCFMGFYAVGIVIFGSRPMVIGLLGAALSLATIYATAMIYAQLATVPRWNSLLTPVYFLTSALAGGALLAGTVWFAVALLLVLSGVQVLVWMQGDLRFSTRGHTLESATGLGALGRLRLFEPPHTGSNYLLNEFVHRVGRRHAVKLRIIAVLGMGVVPALLLMTAPGSGVVLVLAVLVHFAGMAVSRWLFFAEAEHVVALYYGVR